jgi:Coenzyme PQQ synthesis protein D (PqqD)
MIVASCRFNRSPDVIGAELERSLVLLHTSTWTYLELNTTGLEVWQQLEQPRSFAALVAGLVKEFDVEEERCHRETEAFVEDLLARKFIEHTPETTSAGKV